MAPWLRRLRYVVRRRRNDADLSEEMEFHRAMLAREFERRGSGAQEAAAQARRTFGPALLRRNEARDVWVWAWAQDAWRDVRLSSRLLVRDRGFAGAAILALALGLAATNTVFTFVNAVLLRSAPIAAADRVVAITMRDLRNQPLRVAYPDFEEWQRSSKSFSALSILLPVAFTVSDQGHLPDLYFGPYTSTNLFRLVGQRPILGRDFTPGDDQPGAPAVVILGHGVWTSRYGADRGILGRTITVGGLPATVIGVMPPDMRFPPDPNSDLWMPMSQTAVPRVEGRAIRSFQAIGRLADGVSVAQAREDLRAISARLAAEFPQTNKGLVPEVQPYDQYISGPRVAAMYWSLMVAAGALLLIACANVASLLLTRAAHRAREITIRASLGANRARIVRQLLVEGLLLAVISAVVSVPLSTIGIRFFDAVTRDAGRPYYMAFTMDGHVVAFLSAACLLTGIIFGLAPALHASRTNPAAVLRDGGRSSSAGPQTQVWTSALVVAELALTLVLLSSAALLMRGFVAMYEREPGIDASHVIAVQMPLPGRRYPTAAERLAFLDRVDQRLRGVAAIERAASTSAAPLGGGAMAQLSVGSRPIVPGEALPLVTMLSVGPGYFETLGVRALQGRTLAETDGRGGSPYAVVNRRLATMYFPGFDPVGRQIRLTQDPSMRTPGGVPPAVLTIAGVTPTIRQRGTGGLDEDPVVYVPRQAVGQGNRATVLIRAKAGIGQVIPIVRREIQALDPDMPLFNVRTMDEELVQQRAPSLAVGSTFAVFAAIAFVLSAVGVYGLTAYSISRRMPEIGVRLLCGAPPAQLVWLIIRRTLSQLALGVAIGIAGAIAAGTVLRGLVVSTPGNDAWTLATVVALMTGVSLAACVRPAWRAIHTAPLTALRGD